MTRSKLLAIREDRSWTTKRSMEEERKERDEEQEQKCSISVARPGSGPSPEVYTVLRQMTSPDLFALAGCPAVVGSQPERSEAANRIP